MLPAGDPPQRPPTPPLAPEVTPTPPPIPAAAQPPSSPPAPAPTEARPKHVRIDEQFKSLNRTSRLPTLGPHKVSKKEVSSDSVISKTGHVVTQEKFQKTLNGFIQMQGLEKICKDYREREDKARQTRDPDIQKNLRKALQKDSDEYKWANDELRKLTVKFAVASSADLLPQFKQALEELLKTQAGTEFVASTLHQITSDQDRTLLVTTIMSLPLPRVADLTATLLKRKIGDKQDPSLREASLAVDLLRELHYQIYGQQIKAVVRDWVSTHIVNTHGQVTDRRQALNELFTRLNAALQTTPPQCEYLHSLYAFMRKCFDETAPNAGKATPLLMNIFLLRTINNLITTPELAGLPPYPPGNPFSAETRAAARLAAEIQTLSAVEVAAQESWRDAEFASLFRDLLFALDPANQKETQRYGLKNP